MTKFFPIFNIRYPVISRTDIKYAKISLILHTISLERSIILLILYFWNDLTTFPYNSLFQSICCIQLMNMYRVEQERLHSLLNLGELLTLLIWLICCIIRNLNDYVTRLVIAIWWYVIKLLLYNTRNNNSVRVLSQNFCSMSMKVNRAQCWWSIIRDIELMELVSGSFMICLILSSTILRWKYIFILR